MTITFLYISISGTKKERGLGYDHKEDTEPTGLSYESYHFFLFKYISGFRIVRFIPFLPGQKDIDKENRILPVNQDNVCQL